MFLTWPVLVFLGLGFFALGTVAGSFLNVCIYRIPWQKSVIWPGSRCPYCYAAIAARDNVPIVSWIALRGECRTCGAPISLRYPLVEALVGLLFLGAYLLDVIAAQRGAWGEIPAFQLVAAAYHALFLGLLVAAALIDYDLMIIPDQIAITGSVAAIALGTIWPGVRPEPATAATHMQGFWVGLAGLLAGWGVILLVRQGAEIVLFLLRALKLTELTEGMGLGDLTLLGMIGAFMGWQAAILTFFLAPFFGLGQAAWKMFHKFKKWIRGRQLSAADREMPFGPYLSVAAATLLFLWPKVWRGWAQGLFDAVYVIFWWLLGINVDRTN
jgi:leader peptidase (prepilin peptidase)/N-methyltransferase